MNSEDVGARTRRPSVPRLQNVPQPLNPISPTKRGRERSATLPSLYERGRSYPHYYHVQLLSPAEVSALRRAAAGSPAFQSQSQAYEDSPRPRTSSSNEDTTRTPARSRRASLPASARTTHSPVPPGSITSAHSQPTLVQVQPHSTSARSVLVQRTTRAAQACELCRRRRAKVRQKPFSHRYRDWF